MKERRGIALVLAACALLLIAAVPTPSAWAGTGGPSPYRHDLRRIDGRLRMAIEYAPAELGEGLSASETVCGLAEKTDQRGEAEKAAADWSALSQLTEEVDQRAADRIDSAFGRADSGLLALRDRYARAWHDPAKIRELRLGVSASRKGIRMMREAMGLVEGSFEAWRTHGCQAAIDAIEAGVAKLPAGVEQLNRGMRRLWELALAP